MSAYRMHIKTWLDPLRSIHSDLPLCGRTDTYAAAVLAPGEAHPGVDCKRCLKLWAETGGEHRGS